MQLSGDTALDNILFSNSVSSGIFDNGRFNLYYEEEDKYYWIKRNQGGGSIPGRTDQAIALQYQQFNNEGDLEGTYTKADHYFQYRSYDPKIFQDRGYIVTLVGVTYTVVSRPDINGDGTTLYYYWAKFTPNVDDFVNSTLDLICSAEQPSGYSL